MSNQKRWANGADSSVATQPATSQLFARAVSLHLDRRGDEALFGKAVALQLQKDLKGAAEIYQRILKQNPLSEETLTNLVWLSGEVKDYKSMATHCDRLLGIKPDSLTALQGMAMVAFSAE